jgi:uncharacterized metal-binding protein
LPEKHHAGYILQMLELIGFIAILVIVLGGIIVQAMTSVSSSKRGDSLPKMWFKSGCMGVLTIIGGLAALALLANLLDWLSG